MEQGSTDTEIDRIERDPLRVDKGECVLPGPRCPRSGHIGGADLLSIQDPGKASGGRLRLEEHRLTTFRDVRVEGDDGTRRWIGDVG